MKKADLINEVAKVTNMMKKEASMAVEIFMNLIKKSLKKRGRRMFFFRDLGLSASLQGKREKERIQRQVRR